MAKTEIRIYFVTIPAHAFLHIRNYQSNGYWDFWQKQYQIPQSGSKDHLWHTGQYQREAR